VVASLSGFVAALAALLSGVSFAPDVLVRHPSLNLLEPHRLHFVVVAVLSLAVASVAGFWKDFPGTSSSARSVEGHGEVETIKQFDKEMDDTLREAETRCRDYYIAGLHDQLRGRLPEAIVNFQNSLKSLPTMGAYLNLGWCFQHTGSLREAKLVNEVGLKIAQGRRAHSREAQYLLNLGGVCAELGLVDDALDYFEGAKNWNIALKNERGRALALGNMGVIYHIKGDYAKACEVCKEAFDLSMELDPKAAGGDLLNLARAKANQDLFEEALGLLDFVLKLERSWPDPLVRGNAKLSIAQIMVRQSRFNEGASNARESADIHSRSGNRVGYANALDMFGVCLGALGRMQEAEPAIRQAVSIQRATESAAIVETLNHLGMLLMRQNKFDEAAKLFGEVLRLMGSRVIPDRGVVLMSLGVASIEIGQFALARRSLIDALSSFERSGNLRAQGQVTMDLGYLATKERKLDDAEGHFAKALEIYRELNDAHAEGAALNKLANTKAKKGDSQAAHGLYSQSFDKLRRVSPSDAAMILRNIAKLDLAEGSFEKALEGALEARNMLEGLGDAATLSNLAALIDEINRKKEGEKG